MSREAHVQFCEGLAGKFRRPTLLVILCKDPEKAKQSCEFTKEILDKLLLELDESDVVSFDQGFKYLGVLFIKSLIMIPFDKPKRERKVLYMPPPLNMAAYMLKKKKGW